MRVCRYVQVRLDLGAMHVQQVVVIMSAWIHAVILKQMCIEIIGHENINIGLQLLVYRCICTCERQHEY